MNKSKINQAWNTLLYYSSILIGLYAVLGAIIFFPLAVYHFFMENLMVSFYCVLMTGFSLWMYRGDK